MKVVIIAAVVVLAPTISRAQPVDHGALATAVLSTHCGKCHGGGSDGDRGGFDYVLRFDRLMASGLVVKHAADDSPLLERVVAGEMPPRSIKVRPTVDEIAALRAWIDAGAPGPAGSGIAQSASRIGLLGTDRAIATDLAAAPRSERPHLRYLSFAHLHDAGVASERMEEARAGVAKLVASLSWKVDLPRTKLIGVERAIARIDLRELGWSRSLWDSIAGTDPYALRRGNAAFRRAVRLAKTQTPTMRADWFASAATKPLLYHRILSLPKTVGELERVLGVDRSRAPLRAGFNRSGISKHNRIIERRGQSRGVYMWRSYDFSGSSGRRSIFDHPLGPGGADGFVADGGEVIFGLPNGMQGYMLVDAKGRRIDSAPTDVVLDPSRPNGAVENGISCIGCHSLGIINKRDEVRPNLLANRAAFDARDPRTVRIGLRVYRPAAELEAVYASDRRRFVGALTALGANTAREPVTALSLDFDREIDIGRAAAELGLGPAELRRRIKGDALLGRNLGVLLLAGGTLKRDVFAAMFAIAAPRVGAGTAVAGLDQNQLLVKRCEDGDARDCLDVGRSLLQRGRRELARNSFIRACELRSARGCTSAARLERNRGSKRKLLERGCRRGDHAGCELLAARIANQAPRRALKLLGQACDAGRTSACVTLADSLVQNKDHRAALARYLKACERKLVIGCRKAATLFERGSGQLRVNEPRAALLYREACEAGDAKGCVRAAKLFYDGDRLPKKRSLAAQLFERACSIGDAEGCYRFAKQLRSGKGVKKDKRRAKKLFRLACARGKKRACLR